MSKLGSQPMIGKSQIQMYILDDTCHSIKRSALLERAMIISRDLCTYILFLKEESHLAQII